MCEHQFEPLTNTPLFIEEYGQWGAHWEVSRCKLCGEVVSHDHTVEMHERRIIKLKTYEFEDCPEAEDFYM